MSNVDGRKTERTHWDAAWKSPVAARIPSRLNVNVLDLTNLLRNHVKAGDAYLEIGCAPGKLLAWVSARLRAKGSGLDYSETGVRNCESLFSALELDIALHHADLFGDVLPKSSYDVVASFGFIEHFDDPREAVRRHVELLRPGGTAVICIPNYGGIYGRLQAYFDPDNLSLHNLSIMTPQSLVGLVDKECGVSSVRAYPYGRLSLWSVSLERRIPGAIARLAQLVTNAVGLLQFFSMPVLAPMFVLEIRRS